MRWLSERELLSCRSIWIESHRMRVEMMVHVLLGTWPIWISSFTFGGIMALAYALQGLPGAVWFAKPCSSKIICCPRLGCWTGSAGKLNTASSVIPRVGDERGLLELWREHPRSLVREDWGVEGLPAGGAHLAKRG